MYDPSFFNRSAFRQVELGKNSHKLFLKFFAENDDHEDDFKFYPYDPKDPMENVKLSIHEFGSVKKFEGYVSVFVNDIKCGTYLSLGSLGKLKLATNQKICDILFKGCPFTIKVSLFF